MKAGCVKEPDTVHRGLPMERPKRSMESMGWSVRKPDTSTPLPMHRERWPMGGLGWPMGGLWVAYGRRQIIKNGALYGYPALDAQTALYGHTGKIPLRRPLWATFGVFEAVSDIESTANLMKSTGYLRCAIV